jgi:hypothetical protein
MCRGISSPWRLLHHQIHRGSDGDDDDEEEEQEEEEQQQQPPPPPATASTAIISSTGALPLEALQRQLAERPQCIGYKPPQLGGSTKLLLETPLAYWYSETSVRKIRLNNRIDIRTNGFFAKESGDLQACLGPVSRENETCEACLQLANNEQLKIALAICEEDPSSSNSNSRHDSELPFTHLQKRKQHQKRRAGLASLRIVNAGRKVNSLARTVGFYERIQVLLSQKNVPGLQAALVQANKRNMGAKQVLEMIAACIKRTYKPKGNFTKEEVDMATLFLRLAGPNGLFALRQMLHLPSDSYLYKWACIASFKPVIFKPMQTYTDALTHAMVSNFYAFFLEPVLKGEIPWEESYEKPWMLLMDEVAVDEKVRYSPNGDCILGTCACHRPLSVGTVFSSIAHARKVFVRLKQGREDPGGDGVMLMAKECLVVGAMPMSGKAANCRVIPLLAVGVCKRESVEDNVRLITALLNGWERFVIDMLEMCKRDLGVVYRLATDGCGKRRQAVTRVCNVRKDALPRGLLEALEGMILFDCYGGVYQITVDFDGRHMVKRLRYRLIFTMVGMTLYPGGLTLHKANLQVHTHTHTHTHEDALVSASKYTYTYTQMFFFLNHTYTHQNFICIHIHTYTLTHTHSYCLMPPGSKTPRVSSMTTTSRMCPPLSSCCRRWMR